MTSLKNSRTSLSSSCGSSRLLRAAGSLLVAGAVLAGSSALAQSSYPNPYTWSTLAGKSSLPGSADGTGSAAQFFGPNRVSIDSSGNLYVADTINEEIRKVTPGGVVTTVAGRAGVTGNTDGTGSAALFNSPSAVGVDSSGNLYVVDQGNEVIRKIAPGGVVTTFAGSGTPGSSDGTGTAAEFNGPAAIAIDGSGNLYVADTTNEEIRKVTSGAVVTTLAGSLKHAGTADGTGTSAEFDFPSGIAADSAGNVFVADSNSQTIRMITPAGVVTTLAGSPGQGGYADGTGAAAEFFFPIGIAVDSGGNLYIADNGNNSIRKIAPGGVVTTLAGSTGSTLNADGPGATARFFFPANVAVDASGNVFVTDNLNNTIRKITPSGVVSTLAGKAGDGAAADGTGSAARFNAPFGIVVDASDNLYVSDAGNSTIRKVTAGGTVTTLAGKPGVEGSADGTGSGATFKTPLGLALDGSGNIYVAEQGNFIIRKVTPGGVVTTFAGNAGSVGSTDGTGSAAKFDLPAGVAVDGSGNVYVADYGNDEIRKITAGGVVTTIAGSAGAGGSRDGTGTAARLNGPIGIAVDGSGNLYVAEGTNDTIRMITPAGVVTTIGGTPTISGDTNGTGSSASFNTPGGVAVDGGGNLYVADTSNDEIRKGVLSGAPQIQTAPAAQFVKIGASATFSVAATGGSALSYQWNFNGNAIAGATGSSYSIASVQAGDAGNYSVTVTDSGGSLTSPAATLTINTGTATTRLVNIATRAMVGTGANILIPGFVIGGSGMETLLIRADGPSLTQFGVTGVLAVPTLKVLSGSTVIASNTGWTTSTNPALLSSTAAQVGAFPFSAGSADCAVLVTLAPGAYTVQVSGVNASSGVALAEVYEVATTGTRLVNIATRAQVGIGTNLLIPGFVIRGTGNEKLLVRGDGPSLIPFGVTKALLASSLSVFSGTTVVASNTGWETATDPSSLAAVSASVGAFPFTAGSLDSAQVVTLAPGAYTMQVSGVNSTTGVGLAEVYEIP